MKIHPEGDELFHADGRTDGYDEANSRFSQSMWKPSSCIIYYTNHTYSV